MKKMLLFLFLIVSLFTYSQQAKIDSLKQQYKLLKGPKDKLDALNQLCDLLKRQKNDSVSIFYFNELIEMGNRHDSIKYVQKGYDLLAIANKFMGDSSQAIYYGKKSIEKCEKIDDIKRKLYAYSNLSAIYSHFREFEKSKDILGEAIQLNKNIVNDPISSVLYSNLGIAYESLGDNEKAIKSYLMASKIADEQGSVRAKTMALFNIGYIYMIIKQPVKAEEYLFKAINESKKDKRNEDYEYYSYYTLGTNFGNQDKHEIAIKYFEMAQSYFEKTNNLLYLSNVLKNIGSIYVNVDKPKKAISYAKKALKIAKKLENKYLIDGARATLILAYIHTKKFNEAEILLNTIKEKSISELDIDSKIDYYNSHYLINMNKGLYQKALNYYLQLDDIQDSIAISEKDMNVNDIETKYQTEKKEKENLQLKAEQVEQTLILEKETKQKWYLSLGLLASLFTLGVFGIYYNRNKKQKGVIESLQKELHHRIKNNLSIIDTFIEIAKEEFTDKKFISKLNELQNRIESINEVHQQLYQNQDVTQLKLKKYIDTIAQNVQQSINNSNIEIQQNIPDSVGIRSDKSFPIGLIINEFLTNSFKYAFPSNQLGSININFKTSQKHYQLELSDNGIGLPEDFNIETTESFGMRVIKLLTEQLKGTFFLENINGVQLTIKFPKQ